MTQQQLLTAPFKLLPYQTILKEMNGLSRTETPLITMHILCHPHPLSFLLFAPLPSLPPPGFHFSCLSFTSLSLSPSASVSFPPSFQRWTVLLSFHYPLPICACPTYTHTEPHIHTQIPPVILTFFICNSYCLCLLPTLSVFSKNSINQKCPRFFHLRLFMELLPQSFSWSR